MEKKYNSPICSDQFNLVVTSWNAHFFFFSAVAKLEILGQD